MIIIQPSICTLYTLRIGNKLNINNIINQMNKEYIYNINNTTINNYIKPIQYNENIENILIINNDKEPNIFK